MVDASTFDCFCQLFSQIFLFVCLFVLGLFFVLFFLFVFFIPAVTVGTIDIYRFIPLPVTLTLATDRSVKGTQNTCFIFSHSFQSDEDKSLCDKYEDVDMSLFLQIF